MAKELQRFHLEQVAEKERREAELMKVCTSVMLEEV